MHNLIATTALNVQRIFGEGGNAESGALDDGGEEEAH